MSPEPLDTKTFIRALLDRGWRWSDAASDLLVHPDDHGLCLRYDAAADRLTVSPDLDVHLKLVVPTPASKGRFWL